MLSEGVADQKKVAVKDIDALFNSLTQEGESDSPTGKYEPKSALGFISSGYAHFAQANVAKSPAQRTLELRQVLEDWNRAIDIGLHTVPVVMKTVDPDLYYGISLNLLHELNHLWQAVNDFTRVIEIAPDYVKAHISRGEIYAKLGTHRHAADDFTKAIELDGTSVSVYERRGRSYEQLGQYDLAVNDFTITIERSPKAYSNHYSRANAHRLLGQLDKAAVDYRKVIELASDSKLAKLATNRLDDLAKAIQEMEERKPRKAKRWLWFR